MKSVAGYFIALAFGLTSCSAKTVPPTVSPLPSATPAPPTATLTATPTIPTIEVGDLQIPDPKATNPELFDITKLDSPIVQFAIAFGLTSADVGELKPELRTGVDGKQFVVMTTSDRESNTDFDGSGIPLLIAEQGTNAEWVWSKVTLRKIGDKVGMPIGSLLDLEQPKSLEIGKEQFSNFSMVNVGWMYREKMQGVIDFSYSDQQNHFANDNNMMPIAQHLVYTEEIPDWVKKGNFTPEQLTSLLKKHIQDTMSHYPDVKVWSVVNEAWFKNDVGLDFWYSKLGKDYIKIAFETARQENPSAILCYSDFGNEVPGTRSTWNHEIVGVLKENSLIDGLMMHMRIDAADPPTKDNLINMMQSYGVPIYITELTVDLTHVKGTREERFLKQADVYKTIMEAAIESGVTKSFVMWGIGDSANYLEIMVGKPNADPTIYTDNYLPKPAYYALLQGMLKYARQP